MDFINIYRKAVHYLKKSGIENPEKESAIIISNCLKKEIIDLLKDNPTLNNNSISCINASLKRRSKREPLQYIIGFTEFYGITIKTGKGVLIPRPETEILVNEAIKILKNLILKNNNIEVKIIDLCTGSGCIAISLGKYFPESQIFAIDNSSIAIKYAKENSEINNVSNITFIKGNLFSPLTKYKNKLKFDMIISNPPYIKTSEIKDLMPEVRLWEPIEALNGGEDGLKYYRLIIPEAREYLKKGGYLLMEIGEYQAISIKKLLEKYDYLDIKIKKDFSNKDRIIISKYI